MLDRILEKIDQLFTTILNLLYGSFGAALNRGLPEARRILRAFEWLAVALIISGVYAIMHHDVPILFAVLLVILLLYYGAILISNVKIKIKDLEIGGLGKAQKKLSLIFMFLTPPVILLLFDTLFATSKVGAGLIIGYFIFGLFFDWFGRFTGIITNAAAYWLTLFMLATLGLIGWKNAFSNNYLAHKLALERWVNKLTAGEDRGSFNNGLAGAATYTKITAEVFCFYKSSYTFSPARQDTNKNEHLKLEAGTEVAIVNHGTAPEMWGDEQMVLVRMKDPMTKLFTGKIVWVPSRFLDNFQSPLDYRPKSPIAQTNNYAPLKVDTTTIVINKPGEWVLIDVALHKDMRVYINAPYKNINGKFSWMYDDSLKIPLQPIYKYKNGSWWGNFIITAEPDDPETKMLIQIPEAKKGERVQYWIKNS